MRLPTGVRFSQVQTAPFYKEHRRVERSPKHSFNIQARPFALTPFAIAPVLPGETLKSVHLQARSVSHPILSPIIGWWIEHYLFYVKLRDLAGRSDFAQMFIDPDYSLSSYLTAADVEWYHGTNGINWQKLCAQTICDSFFRNEGEAYGDYLVGNMYGTQIKQETWMNSALLVDNLQADMAASVDLDASGTITPEEVRRAMVMWEFQLSNNLTDMSFEDYCATYGVKLPQAESHVPELIAGFSDWTYPTNTVDPTNGTPRSAVSWSINGKRSSPKLFKEPGFLVGFQVVRPKVYLKNTDGAASGYLQTALNWSPAIMADDPLTSLRREGAATGPLQTIVTDSDGYVWDTKDLLVYGDQFTNKTLSSATDLNVVALPAAASLANMRYPASTEIDAMFVNAAGGYKYINSDGLLSLEIAGRTWDTTPGVPAA